MKHTKHIHASNKKKLINGKRKERRRIEYLLHERALLINELFRNQRSLFTSLRSQNTLLTKKKFLKQKPPERL